MRGGTAGAVPQSHFAGLRHMPLVHVGLLGRGWTRESMQHVLLQLPDTVTCISLAGEARVAIKLGQDDQGKVRVWEGHGYSGRWARWVRRSGHVQAGGVEWP